MCIRDSPKTVHKIKNFILEEAKELLDYISEKSITHLIGCSGSFEIIPAIKEGKYPPIKSFENISIDDFHSIKNQLFRMDIEERKQLNGLPPVRAELIVVAFVLMDFLIEKLGVESISISKYAVKEGLISELLS